MLCYDVIGAHYIVLDKDKNVAYDSRVGDPDIRKYSNNTVFNQKEYEKLSGYLKKRIVLPVDILGDELMFYLEEYLKFRGISKPFGFCKINKKTKGVLNDINSGYYAKFGTVIVIGGLSGLLQKIAITLVMMTIIKKKQ